MKKQKFFFFLSLILSLSTYSQTLIPYYLATANSVSASNIDNYLTEIEGLGVKTTGSQAQINAMEWLKTKYLSFGYTNSQIVEDPYTLNSKATANLVVTKTGTVYPNTFVIICGHYDSIIGPGVNDNGSGVSVILEVARILQSINTEYSIKFINFSGEEQGLYGSQHYVQSVVNATNPKMNIRLVINIDQVGGVAGQTNNTITCEKDNSSSPSTNNTASATMTNQLKTCMGLYSNLQTNLANAYASDYMPFQSNGEIITGLYEYNESPYPHSVNDTKANMDPAFVLQVAKGMVGAAMHFSVVPLPASTIETSKKKTFIIYPNPVKERIYIKSDLTNLKYKLFDLSGKIVQQETFKNSIFVENLPKGNYILEIYNEQESFKHKICVE